MCCVPDSPAFRERVRQYPSFFAEARNIFLLLCADGIAPFINSDDTSITPICFTCLNFPPSIRGKKEYVGTWGIYEGKSGQAKIRGKKIVSKPFFDLLVEELSELWETGHVVYDMHTRSTFRLFVMVYRIVLDYKGIEDVAQRTGTNSYMACSKCTIRGVPKADSLMQKIIYSEPHSKRGMPSCHSSIYQIIHRPTIMQYIGIA